MQREGSEAIRKAADSLHHIGNSTTHLLHLEVPCHLYSYGLYSSGLYSHTRYTHGLYSNDLYIHGLYSHGLRSYGRRDWRLVPPGGAAAAGAVARLYRASSETSRTSTHMSTHLSTHMCTDMCTHVYTYGHPHVYAQV